MNKKGFTLIELIGTIVILSLVVLIAVPAISRSLNKGVKEADDQFKKNVELAAKNWASDNKNQLPTAPNGPIEISVEALKSGGYLDGKVVKPSDNKNLHNGCVVITRQNEADAPKPVYGYEFKENC